MIDRGDIINRRKRSSGALCSGAQVSHIYLYLALICAIQIALRTMVRGCLFDSLNTIA